MKRLFKWTLAAGVIGAAGLQFFNPTLTNPPVEAGGDLMATNGPPASVAGTLHEACYDCHSNETQWPWYSHVSPFSWFLVNHVNDGREAMNFSAWPHGDAYGERKRWTRIANHVESGDMPLQSYGWIHAKSRLTAEQRGELVAWARNRAQALEGK